MEIMRNNHDLPTAGHQGIAKTAARVALKFYWPGMFRDAKYARKCRVCQRYKAATQAQPGLNHAPKIKGPWETISLDIVGPLPRSTHGHCYILVAQDRMNAYHCEKQMQLLLANASERSPAGTVAR